MEILNAVVKAVIKGLIFIIYCLTYPFVKYKTLKKPQRCPPINNKLLLIPAIKLAEKIRRKELTSEEIVSAYISRCQQVNPIINAIVENRFDVALEEAREIDQFIKSGIKSEEELAIDTPLLGLPVTVKESISVKGMSHGAGRKVKETIRAKEDSDAVKRIKNAGGIPILVSNTPEMCMCWETYNNVTGTTWNPYDTRRTSGGSSGGEAALLGCGASLLSVSSDIGGSARLPAMFCGVFGHKPTSGWVSTDGHMPDCDDPAWPSFFTIAPMVRYAHDLSLMLKVMSQSESAVSLSKKNINLNKIKFMYMEHSGSSVTNKVDSEIITGIHRFNSYLENIYTIQAQKVEIPEMKYAFEASVMMLLRLNGVDTIFKKGSNPHEWKSVFAEVLRYIFCMSPHTLTNVAYGVLKKVEERISDRHYQWLRQKNLDIKKRFQELLGENGVIIYPTFVSAAHFPYEIYPKICNVTYMMIFNAIGLPVTQCPVGFNREGLPIGFQVIGNAGQDHLTIQVAKEVEKAFGGWHEPPFN